MIIYPIEFVEGINSLSEDTMHFENYGRFYCELPC